MIPEAVVAMLACQRLGAVHSVVFGGFSAKELASRIDAAQPKMVLAASCGVEPKRIIPYHPLLDEAIEIAAPENKPSTVFVLQRPQCEAQALVRGRDFDWHEAIANFGREGTRHDCVPVPSSHVSREREREMVEDGTDIHSSLPTSSTPRERLGSQRECSVTLAATPSRCSG